MADKYGLLGRKLGHSWSPQIHTLLCGYDYGLYETEPVGYEDQDMFYNICVLCRTTLSPEKLLDRIHEIEAELADIQDAMTLPENSTDPGWMHEKSSKMAALEAEVTDLYDEWMELQ